MILNKPCRAAILLVLLVAFCPALVSAQAEEQPAPVTVSSRSLQDNFMYMLSFTAKASFILHAFPFEFPIFLGVGMDIIKYGAQSHLDFILKPGFASLWK